MPEEQIIFRLSRNDAGQVIDGLTVCHENWQKTLDWYDDKLEDPDFVVLECSGRIEAGSDGRGDFSWIKIVHILLLNQILDLC